MANRTVKDAQSIHGTNPQYLVEKIIRTRIYDSRYWKEECFALTAELLVDKAMALRSVGGIYGGNIKPTSFLCLILKMLQIQPEKDIVIEFIKQDEFKYVRALGAFYLRLVHSSLDCYKYLEPLLNDYRKLRLMNRNGQYVLSQMDDFIDLLLREERMCDVILPRVQKRWVHEANNELEPRVSLLEDDLDDLESESEDELPPSPPQTPPIRSRSDKDDSVRGANREFRHAHSRHSPQRLRPERDREREKRYRSRSRERFPDEHERKRRRSRSRDRRHKSPGHRRHRERGREREREARDRNWDPREREHKRKERDDRNYGREREEREYRKDKRDKERRKHRRERRDYGDEDPDIAEANALRASLGLPFLRP